MIVIYPYWLFGYSFTLYATSVDRSALTLLQFNSLVESWIVNFITDEDEIFGFILLIELGFKVFLLFQKEDIAINRFGIKHVFRSGKEEILGYLGVLVLFGSFAYQVILWF